MALLPRIILNDGTDGVARKKALADKVEAAAVFDEKEHPRAKDGKFDDAATAAKAVVQKAGVEKAIAEKTAAEKALMDVRSGGKNTAPPELARGKSSKEVGNLQEYLNDNQNAKLAVDGKFGPKTEAAVKAFQKSKGLKETGIVGLDTWKALGVESWHYEDKDSKGGSSKKSTRRNPKRNASKKKTSHSSSKTTSDSPAPSSEPKKSISYILQRGGEREDA